MTIVRNAVAASLLAGALAAIPGAANAAPNYVGPYKRCQRDLPRALRLGGGWGTGGVVDGWFANGGLRIGPHIELMAEWVEHENRSFVFGGLPAGDLESKPGRVNVGARFRVPG